MKQLFLIFALLYVLNIQASDIYVALGQSIGDAVRQAREMVRKGEAASVTIRLIFMCPILSEGSDAASGTEASASAM